MNIIGYEFGWLVDEPLTEDEADKVFKAVAGEVEFRGCYYKKGTCEEKKEIDDKSGKASLLVISAKTDYARPEKRQILFFRDNGDGTYYLEGDVQADWQNQVFFIKGLESLCSIWGCPIDDFLRFMRMQ